MTDFPETRSDREFYTTVMEQVDQPIFVKNKDFRFVLINEAFCQLTGLTKKQILDKTDYDIFSVQEADWFRKKEREVFASVSPTKADGETITLASGTRRFLTTTRIPLQTRDGEVTHLVGIIHDITRLKAAEDALRQANEQLERRVHERTAALEAAQEELVRKERLAMLGQLAGGVAHQIRNPLASITNAVYLLQKASSKYDDDNDIRNSVSIIVEEAWKANRIISGLLDHARVRTPIRYPTDTIRMVRTALSAHPSPDNISLTEILPEVPEVAVDPNQVQEALGNLLQNAYDAMPKGGKLTVQLMAETAVVVIMISDNGPGIPEDVQRLLFRPLITTKPYGLGLGLTTAQMLIGNQGGTIGFHSTPGKGTTFEIRLPIALSTKSTRTAKSILD